MLHHYITITFRNILKHKTQSFTAIFALAFGLVCLVPALCWMHYETSFESSYPDAGRLYRVYSVEKQSGKVNERVPGLLSEELRKEFPGIEASADFLSEQLDYTTEAKEYLSLKTLCVDSAFFQVFPQRAVAGDLAQALQRAGSMVLTESAAIRLCGDAEKALGQKLENELSRIFGPCTVTAVVQDPPTDTNLPFDAVLNFPAIQDASMIMPVAEQWKYFNNELYVKLHAEAKPEVLAGQLADFTTRVGGNADIELRMLPISEVRHQLDTGVPFTLSFIRLLVAAGVLLMFSSLFNFLNLHLALFRQRSHEFRLRMIQGAGGRQLVGQMLFELGCSVLLALVVGGWLLFTAYPWLSELLGMAMPVMLLLRFFGICSIGMTGVILLVSLIPCWRIVRSIAESLTERKMPRQPVLQRMAVSLQLAVSVVFIIAASVIMLQMHFVSGKDLGFERDGIIQLYSPDVMKLGIHREALMQHLRDIPQIQSISTTLFEPTQDTDAQSMTSEVEWPGKPLGESPVFQGIFADENFAETFGLRLLAGRWWSEREKNMKKVVLNEEAVRVMGLSNPVGTVIRINPNLISSDGVAPMEEYEVVGVVNDFHSLSLRSRIYPAIFRQPIDEGNSWYVRVVPGEEQDVMQRIIRLLPEIDASLASVRVTLLDDLYDRLNYSEQTGLKLFGILAVVCLSISLFGVYAVATATAQRRRKEIAIRKIVGANADDIIRMFLREYTLLVLIAGAVAMPLAYTLMQHWLQGYAYRTDIPWWLWGIVLGGIIAVVLLTVWVQVLKAANSNPSEVVKSGG